MASQNLTAQIEALPKIAKVLAFLLLCEVVPGVFRIIKYTETKNTVTLVAGILSFFTFGVMGIIDAITELLYNKVTFFAD
jgi:hypothetical protein